MAPQRKPRNMADRTFGIAPEERPVIPLAYRVREAAAALGVSERTLHTLATNREVPSFKLDPSRLAVGSEHLLCVCHDGLKGSSHAVLAVVQGFQQTFQRFYQFLLRCCAKVIRLRLDCLLRAFLPLGDWAAVFWCPVWVCSP